jgi:hypothetical protein
MYGIVVSVHLLSLFSAPDMLAAVQGFVFWGIGLHYFHGLSGQGAIAAWGEAVGITARGSAGGDGGGGAGVGGEQHMWVAAGDLGGRDHEASILIYIAVMALLVALRAPAGTGGGAEGGSLPSRRVGGRKEQERGGAGAAGKWRPVGGVGSTRQRRGRTRRRFGEEEEEEEEEEQEEEHVFDASEPLSEDISDSDEEDEEEQPLRFPSDPSRDLALSVEAFAKSFLEKFPKGEERQLEGEDGSKVVVSKQFVRDLPTMVRINGRRPMGESNEDKAVRAYRQIESSCNRLRNKPLPQGFKGPRKQASPAQVMAIATQNLGIYLYEEIVRLLFVPSSSKLWKRPALGFATPSVGGKRMYPHAWSSL